MHKRLGCFKNFGRKTMIVILLAISVGLPRPSYALSDNYKAVLIAGGYGALAGTVVGAVVWPFSRDVRALFVGTSVGIYLGLTVGIYYVLAKNDPDNPLRPRDEVIRFSHGQTWRAHSFGSWALDPQLHTPLQFEYRVLTF